MSDPYVVLGVPRTATEDEITQAYRRLARKYHPDLNPGDDTAEAKMKAVNGAYEAIREIQSGGSSTQNSYGNSYRGFFYGGSAYGQRTYGNQSNAGGTGGYGFGQQNPYGSWGFYGGSESGYSFGFGSQQDNTQYRTNQSRSGRRPLSIFKIILYLYLAQMFLSFLLRGTSLIAGYGYGREYKEDIYHTPPYEHSQWYEPEEDIYQMP